MIWKWSAQHYAGIHEIALERIVGSLDRSRDFDRSFRPRTSSHVCRLAGLRQAFASREFPPISVYEVNGQYFIADGHYRAALAHERGMFDVDAEVIRTRTQVRPRASRNH